MQFCIYANQTTWRTITFEVVKKLTYLKKKVFVSIGLGPAELILSRRPMGSTDQADPSCFYFRIS